MEFYAFQHTVLEYALSTTPFALTSDHWSLLIHWWCNKAIDVAKDLRKVKMWIPTIPKAINLKASSEKTFFLVGIYIQQIPGDYCFYGWLDLQG